MTTEDVAFVLAIDEPLRVANLGVGRLLALVNLVADGLSHFLELLLGVLLGLVGRARVRECGLCGGKLASVVNDRDETETDCSRQQPSK